MRFYRSSPFPVGRTTCRDKHDGCYGLWPPRTSGVRIYGCKVVLAPWFEPGVGQVPLPGFNQSYRVKTRVWYMGWCGCLCVCVCVQERRLKPQPTVIKAINTVQYTPSGARRNATAPTGRPNIVSVKQQRNVHHEDGMAERLSWGRRTLFFFKDSNNCVFVLESHLNTS